MLFDVIESESTMEHGAGINQYLHFGAKMDLKNTLIKPGFVGSTLGREFGSTSFFCFFFYLCPRGPTPSPRQSRQSMDNIIVRFLINF